MRFVAGELHKNSVFRCSVPCLLMTNERPLLRPPWWLRILESSVKTHKREEGTPQVGVEPYKIVTVFDEVACGQVRSVVVMNECRVP